MSRPDFYSAHIVSLRAMAITALACWAFWGIAQRSSRSPAAIDPKSLIDHLTTLRDSGQYETLLNYADSIATVLNTNNLRADWYKVLKLKTLAQQRHGELKKALVQLLPLLQAQTIDDIYTIKLHGLLGYVCVNTHEYELGVWHCEQYLTGLLRHRIKEGLGVAYMNLGYALKQQGDYRAARQYYQTAIPLLEQEGNTWNLSEAYINLGDMGRWLFEFEAARAYYNRAAQVFPESEGRLASNLGWSYSDEGRYREALAYFQASCKHGPCAEDLARIMAHCSEALGDTMEANRLYRVALESAPTALDSGKVQWYIGNTMLQRKQPAIALRFFQAALHNFFPNIRPDELTENPSASTTADFWPVLILQGKAKAFHASHAQSGAVQDLHQAWDAISAAVVALDALRTNMRNETSGQDAVDYAYSTFETGIQIALSLERAEPGRRHAETAYVMAEHAKSNALKTSLLEKELLKSAAVPDSLRWQEKSSLATVAYWEEIGRPDSLLSAVRHLEQVRSKIDKYCPAVKKARKQAQSAPVADIQRVLKNGEILLQYFWGDSTVIVFAIGKDNMKTHCIPRDTGLVHSLDRMLSALTNWQLSPAEYSACATPVYQKLCAPVITASGKPQRLVIVPDGPLWSLPFEALTDPSGHFLLQGHAVGYHWSGALWLQEQQRDGFRLTKPRYGGFAPQYPAPSGAMATLGGEFGDLPEARQAVVSAAADLGGTVWQGPSVDKALFQREAEQYGILHLAMHGVLDRKDRTRTGLAFPAAGDSIRLLNTVEISQMNLSAQLAVLSACNTGNGVVYRGEGVMSLSRAFALAGCPAMVANLWEVPSRETNDITAAFLGLLNKGGSKDLALRNAKLAYLEQAEAERRHPFFWAGQVLIGSEKPIWQGRVWASLCIVILGILSWFFLRFRR